MATVTPSTLPVDIDRTPDPRPKPGGARPEDADRFERHLEQDGGETHTARLDKAGAREPAAMPGTSAAPDAARPHIAEIATEPQNKPAVQAALPTGAAPKPAPQVVPPAGHREQQTGLPDPQIVPAAHAATPAPVAQVSPEPQSAPVTSGTPDAVEPAPVAPTIATGEPQPSPAEGEDPGAEPENTVETAAPSKVDDTVTATVPGTPDRPEQTSQSQPPTAAPVPEHSEGQDRSAETAETAPSETKPAAIEAVDVDVDAVPGTTDDPQEAPAEQPVAVPYPAAPGPAEQPTEAGPVPAPTADPDTPAAPTQDSDPQAVSETDAAVPDPLPALGTTITDDAEVGEVSTPPGQTPLAKPDPEAPAPIAETPPVQKPAVVADDDAPVAPATDVAASPAAVPPPATEAAQPIAAVPGPQTSPEAVPQAEPAAAAKSQPVTEPRSAAQPAATTDPAVPASSSDAPAPRPAPARPAGGLLAQAAGGDTQSTPVAPQPATKPGADASATALSTFDQAMKNAAPQSAERTLAPPSTTIAPPTALADPAAPLPPTAIAPAGDPVTTTLPLAQNSHDVSIRIAMPTQPGASAQTPVNTLAFNIAKNFDNGVTRFQVRIDPPELGRVDVKMDMTVEGRVQAHLTVERPETLELMMRDARSLEKALADTGLNLNRDALTFSLKDGDGFGAHDQAGDGNRDGASTGPAQDDGDDQPLQETARGYISDTGVDIQV